VIAQSLGSQSVKTLTDIVVEAPADEVWRVIGDFGAHYRFNPLIEMSPIVNGIETGVGFEREVRLYDGAIMRQRVVEYVSGESIVLTVVDSGLPLREAAVQMSVATQGERSCRVSIEVTYKLRYSHLGSAMGLSVKPIVKARYALVLRGLRYFVTIGKPVESDIPH
jgi:hypothetical protein